MSFSAGDSQCRVFPERIIFQAQKLKGAREAVREKLEEYREQYEQMEVRAVAAEMEVTSLKLDMGELTQKVSEYKDSNRLLTNQLNAQQQMCQDSEKNLQRFQRKLSRIRTALTTEVSKLRQSEKDLRLAFDSVMRCVLEFRSDAISKEDFLCAVDLIFSATVQHRETSSYASGRIHTLFGDHERQRLASLSHHQRKSRLAQLMSMLNEKELEATTDEECLSQGEEVTPPPIPPRRASQTQLARDEHLDAPPLPMPLSPPSPPCSQRRKNAVASKNAGVGIYSLATHADSDSNSSDNFEHFTPPARPRKRYRSEPQFHLSPHVNYRHGSSPLPSIRPGSGYIKNSSAVLTHKPTWLVEKHTKKMKKSRSVGDVVRFNVTKSLCADSDDNTGGTMDSGGYARPFEHLKSWRKLLWGMDGSILTGSLPRIDKAVELEESDVSGCTYLDPSELAAVVSQTESKLGRRVSQRLRKRMDTFQSAIYLPLLNVAPEERGAQTPDDENSPSTSHQSPITPYIRMETAIEQMKSETGSSFTFHERHHSSHSGYTSDGSSCDGLLGNAYDEIPLANGIDNALYNVHTSLHPNPITDDTYAAIDDLTELSSAKSRRSESQPTITQLPSSWTKPRHYTDPAMRLEDGYCALEDTLDGAAISLGPAARPPTPPPRTARKISPLESTIANGGQQDSTKLQVPGIGPLPLYTTLRGSHQRIQLVPLSNYSPNVSSDEYGLSDNEHPEHLYSLGKFVAVTPHRRGLIPSPSSGSPTPQRRGTQSATTTDPKWIPSVRQDSREACSSPDVKRKKGRNYPPVKTKRSHTFQASNSSQTELQGNTLPEKSGYLNKMDPKQKHWSRRWFVLRGSELKYYRTKDAFFGLKRPKGVINLDSWCKLSRGESLAAFELATPDKTYHLVSASNKECEEWLRVLEAAMRLQSPAEKAPVLKPKLPTVSGWAQVSYKSGRSQRVWCTLVGNSLDLSSKPGEKPLHRISMRHSTIHKKRDSLLMDAKDSRSHLQSVLLTVTEEDNEVTSISPDKHEDKESWFYHLSAASAPGEQGPELTNTEKVLSEIMQEGGERDNPKWKHPVLNCTLAPLKNTLTSLPSATLSATAKRLFHSVQLFMGTSIKLPGLDYHICSMQHIITTCLLHPLLRDELYCQVLRQIGHTPPSPISSNILQGWYLLFFLIQTFLPQKEKFMWYLTKFLEHHSSSPCSVVASYAQQCARLVDRVLECGPRECRPSQMELQVFLSNCAHTPHTLSAVLKTPVYLSDGSTQEVEFTPTTTVQEFLSQLSLDVGMPDTMTTGFALVSDWPGVEEDACYYLFPESKLCDVISMWTDSLEQLNHIRMHNQRRTISLSYRNRLSFKKHRGFETEREAVLLTYQISEDVFSGRHPVANVHDGVGMAAIMAQIEYGDCSSVQDNELVAREALQRFCPRKFTHLALEHDQTLLQRKLVEQWEELSGKTQQECAHMYLCAAQQWRFYGATLFLAEKKYSSQKTHAIWLAVDEEGTSLLERSTMECLASYRYSEVSTFGSHGDDFMLVVSPHHNSSDTGGNLVEKLLLVMPKVKIREATFLIASYLESHEGPRPNTLQGFKDQEYRKRREYFADYAINYEHGQPITKVTYTQEEIQTWGVVYNKLTELYPTHACKEYNELFAQLVEKCGVRADNIPQLDDISRYLQDRTGFQLRPVAGLLSFRNFLAGFAFRIYYCTQYVRHGSRPLYTPETDVCHELLGHVPLLSDPSFAKVAHVFWFTIEYGICKQDGKQKAYGAGLLSSFGELKYCLGGDDEKPEVRPLNVFEAAKQEILITRYQPMYYLAESFTDAINQAHEFAKTIPHPFTIHYDTDTQSVRVINHKEGVQEMASGIKHNVGIREEPQQKVQTHEEFPSPIEELPSRKSTSEPQQSTSEQAIQMYGDISCDVRTPGKSKRKKPSITPEVQAGSLQDVGVTDQTSFLYKGIAQHFSWKNFGFKLFLPSNALPSGVAECQITIKAIGEGQFKFRDDSEPVSGIYSISSPCTLQKPAVVEIQHCAVVKTTEECFRLSFVVARSTGLQQVLHSFSVEDGGDFSPNNPYGRIEITQFSLWSIVYNLLHGRIHSVERFYSASLYYIQDGIDNWKVHFVITWNLDVHIQSVSDHFGKPADIHYPVEFDTEGMISLGIPEDGINSNGWTITPLSPPVVRKEQVDRYRHGRQIPSCQILVEWADSERRAVKSVHKVTLQGTKKRAFFQIECKPITTSPVTNRIIPVLETEPQLRELENEIVSEIPAKWKAVGIQLGLTANKLDMISIEENNDCQECFRRVFREWKRQNCERSWSVLLRILQTAAVNEGILAEKIRQKLQNSGE